MKNKILIKGIILMLISSLCTSFGQLFWKIGDFSNLILLILGFLLYVLGGISLIISLKFGELSIIHPMMSISYIFALINGYFLLNERISLEQLLGVLIIILGVVFIAKGEIYE